MSAPGRIAGVAYLKFTEDGSDAQQLALRGSFKMMLDPTSREGIAGLDGVHGYKETPQVPFIEGEISLPPGWSPSRLQEVRNATVTGELANGIAGVLSEAWTANTREVDGDEGKCTVRFEGLRGRYL